LKTDFANSPFKNQQPERPLHKLFLACLLISTICGAIGAYVFKNTSAANTSLKTTRPILTTCKPCHKPELVLYRTLGQYRRGKAAEHKIKVRGPDLSELGDRK